MVVVPTFALAFGLAVRVTESDEHSVLVGIDVGDRPADRAVENNVSGSEQSGLENWLIGHGPIILRWAL